MIGVIAVAGLLVAFQDSTRRLEPPVRVTGTKAVTDTGVAATRADVAPGIDGRGEDAVWRVAPVITSFKMWRPTEGKEQRTGFATEAKVAYDASNLYVLVRAHDP